MELKEEIKQELWNVINTHYEKECYTDAIKDACLYITQIIQEKSETDDLDGEKLITNVFSEQKPRLLINKYQTQSEKDEQRGFGFIIRGIICAIRNPISHARDFKFTKSEADAILIFINNYILSKLDDSKEFAYVEDWYRFIFQDNKNDGKKYSEILLENIPKKKRLSLMLEIVENIRNIDEGKYKYFINKLYDSLSNKDKEEVNILLNKKLISMKDDRELRMFFNHFEPSIWKKIDILVKTRIEEIVYEAIEQGILDKGKIAEGSLGTWVKSWIDVFDSKKEFDELLFRKLEIKEEGNYVIRCFFDRILDENLLNNKEKVERIHSGLKRGRIAYKKLIEFSIKFKTASDEIIKEFKEDYENFTQKD